jgi:hypothetical protein
MSKNPNFKSNNNSKEKENNNNNNVNNNEILRKDYYVKKSNKHIIRISFKGGGPGIKGPTRPFTSQKKIQRTPLGSYFFQFYNNL